MRTLFKQWLLTASLAAVCLSATASGLEGAPFQVKTGPAWQLNVVPMPKPNGVTTVESLTNAQTRVLARITKTDFSQSSAQSLIDICGSVRSSFTGHPVTLLADAATTFLGYPAHRFAFENRHANRTVTYEEAMIFVVNRTGWTISSAGPQGRTNEVRETFALFQKAGDAKPATKKAN